MTGEAVLHINSTGKGRAIHICWFHRIVGLIGFKLAGELVIDKGYGKYFCTMETFMTGITDEEIRKYARKNKRNRKLYHHHRCNVVFDELFKR